LPQKWRRNSIHLLKRSSNSQFKPTAPSWNYVTDPVFQALNAQTPGPQTNDQIPININSVFPNLTIVGASDKKRSENGIGARIPSQASCLLTKLKADELLNT